ncbi:DUF951 domain-containing protein [Erysipelothrix tonsillarum]|uniref:DUF951 domain-containing protein n=1 Tax=Erysipelothrix tonsillarum TaxID=38402 RepID=UPI0003713277|nr:DUF951 domain-containing protein [Erysipelothrix tonsillarum]
MIDKVYGLGDIVQMKKDHPCKKSQYFKITRMGADIKIKCEGCGSVIMLTRQNFEKKLKKVIERNEEL